MLDKFSSSKWTKCTIAQEKTSLLKYNRSAQRHLQTQFLCWLESIMATDQNIKNKTLASEIDAAYGKYGTWQVHLFVVDKMYKAAITRESVWITEFSMANWDFKIFSIVLSFMKIENCWYLLYFFWLCNTQSFNNSLKVRRCSLKVRRWFKQ